jgi:hypothetical protein
MLAICRQRAQMQDENASLWLEKTYILEELILNEERLNMLAFSRAKLQKAVARYASSYEADNKHCATHRS